VSEPTLRLDKWLWHARFLKSRSGAQRFLAERIVRVNRVPVSKVSYPVKAGDVVTLPFEREVRVVRILALGTRRGPPAEARALWEEIAGAPPE
jgi:ribosome-associated heat shock protein Hsp15